MTVHSLDGIHDADTISPTRTLIIEAAAKLFYEEGIRSTSVEAIASRAGVTKRTLYYHFTSKDELIAAYLEARDQPTLALYKRWFDETPGPVNRKIEGIFTAFAKASNKPSWKGCGFMRTAAELAALPGHPAIAAGARHKKAFEQWLRGQLTSAGAPNAGDTARQILLLLDGAASVMLIHRDPSYVETAGKLAASLATSKPASQPNACL